MTNGGASGAKGRLRGDRQEEEGEGGGSGLETGGGGGGGGLETFLPNSLLWLIQRDFLEGSTVDEMVRGRGLHSSTFCTQRKHFLWDTMVWCQSVSGKNGQAELKRGGV